MAATSASLPDVQSDPPDKPQKADSQQQVGATPEVTVPSSAVLSSKPLTAANFGTSSVPCSAIQVGGESVIMSDTPPSVDKEESALPSSSLDVPAAGGDTPPDHTNSKSPSTQSCVEKSPSDTESNEGGGGDGSEGGLLTAGGEGVSIAPDARMPQGTVLEDDSSPEEDLSLSLEHMEMESVEGASPPTHPPGKKRKRHWRKKKKSSDAAMFLSEADTPGLADIPTELTEEGSKVSKRKMKRELRAEAMASESTQKEKRVRKAPNAFVSVRVASPVVREKLEAMQEHISEHDPKLSGLCVSTKKLHLTLMVMRLEDDEAIERAKKALSAVAERASKELVNPLQLEFGGVGNFGNSVVFVKMKEGEEMKRLLLLSEIVREEFRAHEIESTDDRPFAAHLTVAKVSKGGGGKNKIRSIPVESYEAFADEEFGSEIASEIELLSMTEPVDEEGYYHSHHKQSFAT